MFEHLFTSLSSYDPLLIYGVILLIPFIENLFPPSPSDLIVVLAGSLIANGTINYFLALVLSSVGSEVGFMLLYYFGLQTDKKIIHTGKLKFISQEAVAKADDWFAKYGYAIILFNRFLSGIRAVISFFAGLAELNIKRTFILSTVSAVAWNVVLLGLGILFGHNLPLVDRFLANYSYGIIAAATIIAVYFLVKYLLKRKG